MLSDVLRSVRLSGSLQFCFMPSGSWQTDGQPRMAALAGGPASVISFHVMVEGTCWMKMDGREQILAPGDVVAFPFAGAHQLGAGSGGRLIVPVQDLPPKPWREMPVLRYGDERPPVRLLCGYLHCDALNFRPLRESLPGFLHVRTSGADGATRLAATVAQMVAEVDKPRAGGLSMLERLTEILFIEVLRHHIATTPMASGWLAALTEPALARCLALIHEQPARDWSVPALAAASGLSRSTLTERFETILDASPMRYLREWRLCLASVTLATTGRNIAAIAEEAGYGTEAAFNRAFVRSYGMPPAAWRQKARQQAG